MKNRLNFKLNNFQIRPRSPSSESSSDSDKSDGAKNPDRVRRTEHRHRADQKRIRGILDDDEREKLEVSAAFKITVFYH